MKKKIVFGLSLVMVVVLLAGCDALVKRFTGPIMEDYLESNDGPQRQIDAAVDDILADISADITAQNIEDYDWSRTDSSITASVDDPPGSISGRLRARGVSLIYNYDILGEAKGDGENIEKSGSLELIIDTIVYDEDQDEIVELTTSYVHSDDEAPRFSNVSYELDPFRIEGEITRIANRNPKVAVSYAGRSEQIGIDGSNVFFEDDSFKLSNTDFGIVAGVNRAILADAESENTGIGFALFLLQE